MGTFLAVSSIIGKSKNEVAGSLANYAKCIGGSFHPAENNIINKENGCIIQEENGNTSIYFADAYFDWNDSAEFMSQELNAPVFSFQIYDGDFWMYTLYNKGRIVDKFNPLPDYFEDNLPDEEMESWKGNAHTIAALVPYIKPNDVDRYLVRWNLEEADTSKAYPADEFAKEDWQLTDFMSRLKLPYPVDDNGHSKGDVYKIWTRPQPKTNSQSSTPAQKPWWKFW